MISCKLDNSLFSSIETNVRHDLYVRGFEVIPRTYKFIDSF